MKKITFTLIIIAFLCQNMAFGSSELRPPSQFNSATSAFIEKAGKPQEGNLTSNNPLEGKRILVIQDDGAISSLQKELFIGMKAEKENIIIASDYETAIEAIAQSKPDIIILDMGFFKLKGGASRRIRWH